ncbi:MAG: AIPR family protein [Halioglobus sp.]
MDRITKSLLNQFTSENGLEALPEDQAFEHLTAHLVTSEHFTDTFTTYDLVTGEGGDTGIDAIAVIVNGTLVSEPEEIEDLADTNGYLETSFIFVQSERSSGFSTAKIGQFGFGVTDFFSEAPTLVQNDSIKLKYRIVDEIYSRSTLFRRGNPRCYLYYATTGSWQEDQNLSSRRDSVVSDLSTLNIFSDVFFDCLGAEQLQELFQKTKNAISTEITFSDRTTYPDIAGVEQAYLGLISSVEYLKLIQNGNEEIIASLFFDNVRDWQEWNPVNSEMLKTLEDNSTKHLFPLMNNGVTIVCREVNPTGNKFLINDYQVVNGCQTSHVLYQARENLDESVMVPIRLIATTDENIKNTIIKSTNRQTPVSEDQLFALSDFPRKLEAYFPTYDGKKQIFYERRSRQYAADPNIEKVRVINMTTMVRAFASIFQELPHRTTRNYKTLLKNIGEDIFNPNHRLEMYYMAAYAHYKLDYLYRSQNIASDLRPARYHLLLGLRLLNADREMPPFNSRDMGRYCESLNKHLWNDAESGASFLQCADIARDIASGNLHRDNIRSESFTSNFIAEVEKAKN